MNHLSPNDIHRRIEHALREGAPSEIPVCAGRLRRRVEAGLARVPHAAPVTRFARPPLVAASIALTAFVALSMISLRPSPMPASTRSDWNPGVAVVESVAALRGAKPERPLVSEAERLRADVERGARFVRGALPRLRKAG